MPNENFIDANGNPWDGNTTYYVGPGQAIQASAAVSPLAESLTIYVNPNGRCSEYTPHCAIALIIMTIGSYKKTLSNINDRCWGGCNNLICGPSPSPFSYTLSDQELSMAISNGSIGLTITTCSVLGMGWMTIKPDAVLEQKFSAAASEGTVTITVVLPDGSPASGATVVLTDTAINQQVGSGTTNSSGVVTFSGLTVGDSFQVMISYDNFGQQQASFPLNSTSYSFTVQLECPQGYEFSNGECKPAPTTSSQIIKGLEIAAVIAGIAGGAMILSKVIPQRSIIEEQVRSVGQTIKQNINKLRGGSEQS